MFVAMGANVPVVPSGKGGAVARSPASPATMTWGSFPEEWLLLLLWLVAESSKVTWIEWHPCVRS